MKEEIIKNIEGFLKEKGAQTSKVVLDYPIHMELGDTSTSVALVYAKELGVKPLDLALEIKEALTAKQMRHVDRIDVIQPGFINFFFDEHYFGKNTEQILKEKDFGKSNHAKGYKVFIEHTQPNPFKEFHIGHLMNNAIGESIARIIKANGAEVKIASYHGDVGMHVAKTIWGIEHYDMNGISMSNIGQVYARASKEYDVNDNAKREIIELNKKIYDKSDKKVNETYELGKSVSLDYFESLYKRLDSHFDFNFYESESGKFGKKLVLENIPKVFEKGDEGAIIFRGENFEPKTHTRVFLNKEGLPTYEAKELGLAQIKKDFFEYDNSITITANEQGSFFKVVEVAIGEVFPELKGKLKHLSHGLLKLSSGKMSSREGNVISAESLIDQVKEKVLAKSSLKDSIARSAESGSREKIDEIAEIIAIGAIKYSILRQAIGGDIIFDFDKSISFEGDSGPYLQYSVVRANSILKKVESEKLKVESETPENWETTNLERLLERFPKVVARSGMECAPHYIVTYLVDLAGEFNSFYASHKIIDLEDKTSSYRLALTKAFAQVETVGLNLLAIKVPEKM